MAATVTLARLPSGRTRLTRLPMCQPRLFASTCDTAIWSRTSRRCRRAGSQIPVVWGGSVHAGDYTARGTRAARIPAKRTTPGSGQ